MWMHRPESRRRQFVPILRCFTYWQYKVINVCNNLHIVRINQDLPLLFIWTTSGSLILCVTASFPKKCKKKNSGLCVIPEMHYEANAAVSQDII